jgi:hypothetical protein
MNGKVGRIWRTRRSCKSTCSCLEIVVVVEINVARCCTTEPQRSYSRSTIGRIPATSAFSDQGNLPGSPARPSTNNHAAQCLGLCCLSLSHERVLTLGRLLKIWMPESQRRFQARGRGRAPRWKRGHTSCAVCSKTYRCRPTVIEMTSRSIVWSSWVCETNAKLFGRPQPSRFPVQ